MRSTVKLLIVLALCVYPLAIYFVEGSLTPSQLAAGLLGLLAARLLAAAWIKPDLRARNIVLALLMVVGIALVLTLLPHLKLQWLRLYPMLFSLAMFAIFFSSLFGTPIVERIARTFNRDFPASAVHYTRRVTEIWCAVMLLNALVSLYTAFWTSFEVWSVYNGIVAYALFAVVFGSEYMVRVRMKRRWTAA